MRNYAIMAMFTAVVLGTSCSTTRQVANNSPFKRFKRIDAGAEKLAGPSFFYMDYTPQTGSRAPASVGMSDGMSDGMSGGMSGGIAGGDANPKEVYFLGLWQQKKKMEKLLAIQSEEICPAFHHTLLETKKRMGTGGALSLNKNWREVFKRSNPVSEPVMALPADDGRDLYSLHQDRGEVDQETVIETFKKFYERTNAEVQELCDTGSSEGYYVYANMVQFYSNNNFMKSGEALKAVLKLAPVANYYVLQSLSSDPVGAAPGYYEAAVLKKLNATWFQNYLYKVNRAGEDKLSSAF